MAMTSLSYCTSIGCGFVPMGDSMIGRECTTFLVKSTLRASASMNFMFFLAANGRTGSRMERCSNVPTAVLQRRGVNTM